MLIFLSPPTLEKLINFPTVMKVYKFLNGYESFEDIRKPVEWKLFFLFLFWVQQFSTLT